jgi:hypothetical protein
MSALIFCCDDRRRALVRQHGTLNGIDILEVVDHDQPVLAERQRLLRVHFVKPPSPTLTARLQALTPDGVLLSGGVRTRGITVDTVALKAGVLEVHVTPRGDYSPYTLSLVEKGGAPLDGLDPQLAAVTFSFKVECPSNFDCRPQRACVAASPPEPDIDHLTKDYASFRQLMLDRMAILMPQWQERNPADVGVALVELLAYVADQLSYQQDAVLTEAYLGTARQRISVRRHARLVDYPMHDGCNARVWVHVQLKAGSLTLPKGTPLVTQAPGLKPPLLGDPPGLNGAVAAGAEAFETMHDIALFAVHNEMEFYTWGKGGCCLPRGATNATLKGHFPDLHVGDLLVFEEILNPLSGTAQDSDPTHRHVVRLTTVAAGQDPLGTPTKSQPLPPPIDITEIGWAAADALPFALCLSATTDALHGSRTLDRVSVARGNIVLADHGRTVTQKLDPVPEDRLESGPPSATDRCAERPTLVFPQRFRPRLDGVPVTQAATIRRTVTVKGQKQRLAFDPSAAAAHALAWDMDRVLPVVGLSDRARDWTVQRDLLASDALTPDFVAETENDGGARLRFGDDQNGMRPPPATVFTTTYRVGNGVAGNVGAGSIQLVAGAFAAVTAVRNPLPAQGGVEPELLEDVRQKAPSAFRIQQRAVTANDYAEVAGRRPEVLSAAASVRWTGSWRTVFVSVDRQGGLPVDFAFRDATSRFLEPFRMAGQDVEIKVPHYMFLEVEIAACIDPDYYRSDVLAALLAVLGSGVRPDGQRGFFHTDNFSFGQPVYLSRLYAAAQAVEGVRSVEVSVLRRLGSDDARALVDGQLAVGPLEIARLDNDPNFPDRGVLRVIPRGGR